MAPARIRFDDVVAGRARVFPAPIRIVTADTAADVVAALDEVDAATRDGMWAAGFVTYEAASGLDPSLPVHPRGPHDPPLVWFALSGAPTVAPVATPDACSYRLSDWVLDVTPNRYRAGFDRIRQAIDAGESYQVNLTARLRATFRGDPAGLYRDLLARQRPAHAALIDTGTHTVVSASPELFFGWQAGVLATRPMKGTALRGRTQTEDDRARAALLASEKERAENLIVVDLLRNDVSRVAAVGSVRVPRIGRLERYETVWQLTSDVCGEVPEATPLVEVFTALFPSGSVTGAPKPRTMQLIRDVEQRPRGVYCGAVGWVAPPGAPTRASFNVAIRTVVIEHAGGEAVYGVGGGITWGSDSEAELAELWAKARILDDAGGAEDFVLIETAGYVPAKGIRHRDAHLARLAESARFFGFGHDGPALREALDGVTGDEPLRVRLRLARDGTPSVRCTAMPAELGRPVTLAIDPEPVDSSGPWLFHKTSRRDQYTSRAARHDTDDVVLVNAAGHATETTIGNLAFRLDGRWWTPPVADGLLPGVERAALLREGVLAERCIAASALGEVEAVAVVSSLRGWRAAVVDAR